MLNQIEYAFNDEPTAYRFLNTVSAMGDGELKAKYGRNTCHVRVSYEVQTGAFDNTLSKLDDLAEQHGGHEVN